MSTSMDPVFADALRRELATHVTAPTHRVRRRIAIGGSAAAIGAVVFGGMTTATGRDVADPPMAAPVIVNGVGATHVRLPAVPPGATYLRVELVCYQATLCATPGGSAESDHRSVLWQRDAVPLTDVFDPTNPQDLEPLPATGLTIDTDRTAHWRLYATYVDRLNPRTVRLGDGRVLGLPGNQMQLPALVPVIADNGTPGYVDSYTLLDGAVLELTDDGTEQNPLPVYSDDGTTVVGEVTVDTPYPSGR